MEKEKNIDTSQVLNNEGNRLVNGTRSRILMFFGYIKLNSDLQGIVVMDAVASRDLAMSRTAP